jgi:hypothetical protein
VTTFGVALAGVATVGPVTVTLAKPCTDPLVAVTTAEPVAAGAIYNPPVLIDPTPIPTLQLKLLGWLIKAVPNWSNPAAVNCCVWFWESTLLAGVTVIVVNVWSTVTNTLLVAVRASAASVIVAVKAYAPQWLNVAVVFAAFALLKVGAVAPLGTAVAFQA